MTAFIMPYSEESEMMVLGCMLTNVESLKIAADSLDEHDFYATKHKTIFQALKNANKNNSPADTHLISEELRRTGMLESIGGPSYLTTLGQFAGTSAYIEEYIKDTIKLSIKRKLISVGNDLINRAHNPKEDPSALIVGIQEKIIQIEKNQASRDKFPIRFLNQFEKNFLLEEPPSKAMLLEFYEEEGRKTKKFGFLPKGIVAMLVGAGGVGKTHLLAQLSVSIASGTPWLDTFYTTENCGKENKGYVFLGLGENQYDDIWRVTHKAAKKLRQHAPDLMKIDPVIDASRRIAAFSFCGQHAAFLEDKKKSKYFREFKLKLMQSAPPEGWSLIILDPVSRLMGADAETDNASATLFISLLEELTIELPGTPTVLFAHHQNKISINDEKKHDQTASRGASALPDGARWQILFTKTKDEHKQDIGILRMTKTNFTGYMEDLAIKKDQDGSWFIPRKENQTQAWF